jgi:cytochrome P450
MAGILHLVQEAIERFDLLSPQGLSKVAIAAALLSLAHQAILVIYALYFHPLNHVPGPPLWIAFPTVRVLYMTRGTSEFKVREMHEKYGPVVRLGPNSLSFITPEAWRDIYGHGHPEMPKKYPPGMEMDTRKIISASAADHSRYRRAMLPAFSDRALLQQEPMIRVYVDLLVERLAEVARTGEPTNIVSWYNFTTFDLIADLAYGKPLNGLAEGKSNLWLDNSANMMRLLPILVMIGVSPLIGRVFKLLAGPKIRASKRNHLAHVSKLANERIHGAKQADRGDFMDYMMRSRGQPHEMRDDELVVNADLIMVAGSETTATLLSGVTYYMLKTPRTLKKATEEVRSAFESSDDINFTEARTKLPYLMACLEEGLRIFPPVPLSISRSVPLGAPVQISGITVPEKVRKSPPSPIHNYSRASLTNHEQHRPLSESISSRPTPRRPTSTRRASSTRSAGCPRRRRTRRRPSTATGARCTSPSASGPVTASAATWRSTRCG